MRPSNRRAVTLHDLYLLAKRRLPGVVTLQGTAQSLHVGCRSLRRSGLPAVSQCRQR